MQIYYTSTNQSYIETSKPLMWGGIAMVTLAFAGLLFGRDNEKVRH